MFFVVGRVQRLLGSSATWCAGHRRVPSLDRNYGRKKNSSCESGLYKLNDMLIRYDSIQACCGEPSAVTNVVIYNSVLFIILTIIKCVTKKVSGLIYIKKKYIEENIYF